MQQSEGSFKPRRPSQYLLSLLLSDSLKQLLVICTVTHKNFIDSIQPLNLANQLRILVQQNIIRRKELFMQEPNVCLQAEEVSESSETQQEDEFELRTNINRVVGDMKREMGKIA